MATQRIDKKDAAEIKEIRRACGDMIYSYSGKCDATTRGLALLSGIIGQFPGELFHKIPELDVVYQKLENGEVKIIERSKQIIKRADAYDAGYANGLRDGKVQSEYFAVLETCREDMKEEFEASPKIQIQIEQFSDKQMEQITETMRELLIEGYWDMLRIAVIRELIR